MSIPVQFRVDIKPKIGAFVRVFNIFVIYLDKVFWCLSSFGEVNHDRFLLVKLESSFTPP